MIYETRLTIPKNTPKTAMVEASLSVHIGMMRGIEIDFPPGCCGLCHVVVYYINHQVWPSNVNSDFSGDDQVIKFDEDYELSDEPLEFIIKGWNLDDTFDHTVTMRVLVKGAETDLAGLIQNLIQPPIVDQG